MFKRYLTALSAVALSLSIVGCQQSAEQVDATDSSINLDGAVFEDHDQPVFGQSPIQLANADAKLPAGSVTMTMVELSCEGCVIMCEEELVAVDGVSDVKANHETELITLQINETSKATYGDLVKAVEAKGFLVAAIAQTPTP